MPCRPRSRVSRPPAAIPGGRLALTAGAVPPTSSDPCAPRPVPRRRRLGLEGCRHYVGGRRVWCPPQCPQQADPRPRTLWSRWQWRRSHRGDDGRFGLAEGFRRPEELWVAELEAWLRRTGERQR